MPVVLLSEADETLRAICVVAAAETDITGVAVELRVGLEEGLPADGVVRVALRRPGRIPCAWLVDLKPGDLAERAGALSRDKVARLEEMLQLGGLDSVPQSDSRASARESALAPKDDR